MRTLLLLGSALALTACDAGFVDLRPASALPNAPIPQTDAGTIEDVVEPYLLQIGFLSRTKRGRSLTSAAHTHLGVSPTTSDHSTLFKFRNA